MTRLYKYIIFSFSLLIFSFYTNCAKQSLGIEQSNSNVNEINSSNLKIEKNSNGEEYAKGRILISPREGLPAKALAQILEEHHGKSRKMGQSNLFIVDLPENTEEVAVERLSHHPHIKFAELDRYLSPTLTPNDPLYTSEWQLPKIKAPLAWDSTQGLGVTVAIIDSGANNLHEDLQGQIVAGWNIWDNNNITTDLTGHGTYVSGTVAALNNNGKGVTSVAGLSKIMPIRVTPPDSGGTFYSTLAQGIIYAADHGVRIANASFQGVTNSQTTIDAAQYLKNKNGLLTVGAGNTGVLETYTATTSMIPVSATDANDLLAGFSSYGNFVVMSAPGVDIWTTDMNGSYANVNGTSFSSPIVAGVIALMMSANPLLSNLDIEKLLYSTAVDLGTAGRDIYFGYGRVDAAAAVQAAKLAAPSVDTQPPVVSIVNPLSGATVSGLVPVDLSSSDNVGVVRAELKVNSSTIAIDTSSPFAFSWDTSGTPNGLTNLTVSVYDAAGNVGTNTIQVNVSNAVVTPPPTSDTTAPTIAITNPLAGSVTGTVTIKTNASDNYGSAGISQSIYIDGTLVASGSGSTLSYSWNTKIKKYKAGTHTIKATAKDAAGNTSSTTVNVNVIK